jgi:glycosyltransferase involved in cell wall biosynthesis
MKSVSIVTPLFNKEPYVGETIRSVLAQTMQDWEMIVVDNGSTDHGPGVVRQFSDSRIALVDSPKRGPGAARNFGLNRATGEWVLFLDADDLIEPDFLSNRMLLAKTNPAAELLVGSWEEFTDGQATRVLRQPTAFRQPAKSLEQSAIAFAPWALHAALIKRSRLRPDLNWPEALDGMPSEDTAFWFPVVYGATIAWTEQAGALYRVQLADSRNTILDSDRWIRAVMGVIDHNVEFLRGKGDSPDAGQCASIFRVLESTYRLALTKRSRTAAGLALSQAKVWLAKCPSSSLTVALRKYLGLRLFNLARYGVI